MKKEGIKIVFAEVQAPQSLYTAICMRISALERRSARLHAAFFAALSLVCGVALIPALQYAAQQFATSGFYDYLTLMFSDSSLVVTYWREFGLSLIDSLPSLALLLLIPIVVLLAWSLKRTAQTARTAFA